MFKRLMIQKINLKMLTIPRDNRLNRIAFLLISLFFLTAIQRFWVHPSGGHTHRQADTIGMSMAFAEQVRERGVSAFDFLFYPRILQHGLLDGINAAEFPLLNVIGGFGFLLSSDPWVGVFISALMILMLNFFVAFFSLPKVLRAWQVDTEGAICLLFWFAGSTVAAQSAVIMPEGVAFPLVIAGMAELLDSRSRIIHFVFGVFLCTLGIAVKPTAVIAMGALLALPVFVEVQRKFWRRFSLGFILSLVFPAWWYTVHAKSILNFAQGPQIFALAHFNPLERLRELGFSDVFWLMRREAYQGQFPMFVGWLFLVLAGLMREWVPIVLYLVSLLFAMALDGEHIKAHYYYFIGSSIFSVLVMARVYGLVKSQPVIKAFLLIVLSWGVIYNIRGNIWVWARDSMYWKVNLWDMGSEARKIIDRQYHLVTDDGAYPLKLLFIGRSGSAFGGNVYQACSQDEYRHRPLALVSEAPPPRGLVFCDGRATEFNVIDLKFAKWFVTLVK